MLVVNSLAIKSYFKNEVLWRAECIVAASISK